MRGFDYVKEFSTLENTFREKIWQIALQNSVIHGGKAQSGPVLGKLLSEYPELKVDIKSIVKLVNSIVQDVNNLSLDE
ncbi:MAG: hypothetical protein ACFFBD_29970, partial [Candidatus Hodarchaeota archaeon]